jgi:hypothetical protein
VHLVRHASSQLAVAVQAGPRREVQLAVAVRGEQRIRTQLTQLTTIPVVQGLEYKEKERERMRKEK